MLGSPERSLKNIKFSAGLLGRGLIGVGVAAGGVTAETVAQHFFNSVPAIEAAQCKTLAVRKVREFEDIKGVKDQYDKGFDTPKGPIANAKVEYTIAGVKFDGGTTNAQGYSEKMITAECTVPNVLIGTSLVTTPDGRYVIDDLILQNGGTEAFTSWVVDKKVLYGNVTSPLNANRPSVPGAPGIVSAGVIAEPRPAIPATPQTIDRPQGSQTDFLEEVRRFRDNNPWIWGVLYGAAVIGLAMRAIGLLRRRGHSHEEVPVRHIDRRTVRQELAERPLTPPAPQAVGLTEEQIRRTITDPLLQAITQLNNNMSARFDTFDPTTPRTPAQTPRRAAPTPPPTRPIGIRR